jgi:hypothetical protein
MKASNLSTAANRRHAGGRPPKFAEARRVITITLPQRTLEQLAAVGPDRAKAIVKLVDSVVRTGAPGSNLVDLVEVTPGKCVVLVSSSSYLAKIPWLRMVEIAPARFLLSVPSGTAIESLEVAVRDLLEDVPREDLRERALLEALLKRVNASRRSRKMSKEEILFFETG